jgi:hypothetical protein
MKILKPQNLESSTTSNPSREDKLVMKMVMPNMDDGDGDVAFSSSLKS